MRKYSAFSALWRAPLLQKPFFQDVAQNWRGIGVLYLELLLLLSWLAVLIYATVGISSFLNNEAPAALKDFPTIQIAKGVATSDVPQPYIMKGDHGEPIFVLDTTGTTKLPADVGAKLLLTSTELIQDDGGRIQRHPLSQFPDSTIDQAWILSWIRLVRNWTIPAGTLVLVHFSLVYRLVLALIFAAIGLGFASMFKAKLSYAALLRLAIVSMTGPILLDTILWILPIPNTCGIIWAFLHLATLGYLIFAIKAAAEVLHEQSLPYAPDLSPIPPPPPPPQKPGEEFFP